MTNPDVKPIVLLYDTVFLFLVLYQVYLLKPDVPSALKKRFFNNGFSSF